MTATHTTKFDPLHTPLAGTTLIEASAGTGKTHAIACLVCRLVALQSVPLDRILVVTFTQAACEELKTRIRGMLASVREALITHHAGGDAFLAGILASVNSPDLSARLVTEALHRFDEASVFTIHGFCRKLLQEHAFESNSPFDIQLVHDQTEIVQQVVQDYWRTAFYAATATFVSHALARKCTWERLLELQALVQNHPHLRIIPDDVNEVPTESAEAALQADYAGAQKSWATSGDDVARLMASTDAFDGRQVRKGSVPSWIATAAEYFSHAHVRLPLTEGVSRLCTSWLSPRLKKGKTFPAHPFFDINDRLVQAALSLEQIYDKRLMTLMVRFADHARAALPEAKRKKMVLYFDDLLTGVYRALHSDRGPSLAASVHERYAAALIDEFQDTDPLQYAIFSKLFDHPKPLVLIGDPKQSIYGFRGADLYAYLGAAAAAHGRFGLTENWRSSPELIRAVNTIFTLPHSPFILDEIVYAPVTPASRSDRQELRMGDAPLAPLRLWFMGRDSDKPIGKGLAQHALSHAVAGEVVHLLAGAKGGTVVLGSRPLAASDIAVLVRNKSQALLVRKALSDVHVPSVVQSTESLFDSREAEEMQRLLAAVAEPGNTGALRAALATDMLGGDSTAIWAGVADDSSWERVQSRFVQYHDQGEKWGFFRMFRELMSAESVPPRLLAYPDGERRITNIEHLAELLHSQERADSSSGLSRLVKWLAEHRDKNAQRRDEDQIRLERDENAVQIVTIHRCKGLQYPVVFAPFLWEDSKIDKDESLFHDPDRTWQATLDIGSSHAAAHKVVAEREQLAENLRLAYVALTRAQNRCYVAWGRFALAETSALAYLFHQPAALPDDMTIAVSSRVRDMSDEDMLSEVGRLAAESGGSIEVAGLPSEAAATLSSPYETGEELTSRAFTGYVDRTWGFTSFSALTAQKGEMNDRFDERLYPVVDTSGDPPTPDIFSFPKGSRPGSFFHHVIENIDFCDCSAAAIGPLVAESLKRFGLDADWAPVVVESLRRLVTTHLVSAETGLTLSSITPMQRLNELEFHLPVKHIAPQTIADLFARRGIGGAEGLMGDRMSGLQFSPVRGFMRGFMDLVFEHNGRFYLVDWKSNHLGNRTEDYSRPHLAAAMAHECYVLQYHLYVLALDAYLSIRIPGYRYETHFGSVYYIFLRGLDPAGSGDYGIFSDRPSQEFVEEMRRVLLDLGRTDTP